VDGQVKRCWIALAKLSAENRGDVSVEFPTQVLVSHDVSRAMTGSVPFEEALAARLSLFKPSLYQVNECMEKRPPR
jgi:hypothetical protein